MSTNLKPNVTKIFIFNFENTHFDNDVIFISTYTTTTIHQILK